MFELYIQVQGRGLVPPGRCTRTSETMWELPPLDFQATDVSPGLTMPPMAEEERSPSLGPKPWQCPVYGTEKFRWEFLVHQHDDRGCGNTSMLGAATVKMHSTYQSTSKFSPVVLLPASTLSSAKDRWQGNPLSK